MPPNILPSFVLSLNQINVFFFKQKTAYEMDLNNAFVSGLNPPNHRLFISNEADNLMSLTKSSNTGACSLVG